MPEDWGYGGNSRDRESAKAIPAKERTNLLLWIGGRKFHYYCWALGLDDEKVAEYIFRVLRGDVEAIEQFEVAVKEIETIGWWPMARKSTRRDCSGEIL